MLIVWTIYFVYIELLINTYCLILLRGRDFRKAYENLGEVRSLVAQVTLTATITKASLTHIVNNLDMEGFVLIKCSNNRKNIFYSVEPIHRYQDNDFEKMELAFGKCFKSVVEDLKKMAAVQTKE